MGKGSKRRQEDFKKVQSNWDFIDWKSKSKAKSQSEKKWCAWCGAWGNHTSGICDALRRNLL